MKILAVGDIVGENGLNKLKNEIKTYSILSSSSSSPLNL